ncbi:hypothetical protein C4D60_Mb01t12380 [Musa balbisiana]|uniref:Uncharacterized protein n=1 Tax=Musa balbisiana TaxID=52838 RepID=A0A4S8JM07_MUSBA|nr:hypothetical protein C4D60_Mb01t12380 [Musa balbisiana]
MSRRVGSNCHNKSLRLEPVLRTTNRPPKATTREGSPSISTRLPRRASPAPPFPFPFPPPRSGVPISAASSASYSPLVVLLIRPIPSSRLLWRDRPERVLDGCAGVGTSYIDLLRRRMGFSGLFLCWTVQFFSFLRIGSVVSE